jgi:putative endonuclease
MSEKGMFQNSYQVKNKKLGQWGEQVACQFLLKKGYNLVAKNYHIFGGELDIIVQKNGILTFVEVKTRSTQTFGTAAESLNHRKIQKLYRAILIYLEKEDVHHSSTGHYPLWQLDLIAIDISQNPKTFKKQATIKHYKNILQQ